MAICQYSYIYSNSNYGNCRTCYSSDPPRRRRQNNLPTQSGSHRTKTPRIWPSLPFPIFVTEAAINRKRVTNYAHVCTYVDVKDYPTMSTPNQPSVLFCTLSQNHNPCHHHNSTSSPFFLSQAHDNMPFKNAILWHVM